MVLDWNNSKVESLISFVKEFPALYDVSSEDYTNKDEKEKLWDSIGKKLGTTARNCRRKWTGMCLKYNKLKEAGSVFDNGEEWTWFEYMRFIEPDIHENGCDDNAESSTVTSFNSEVQCKNGANGILGISREQDSNVADVHAVKDILTSLVSSLSLPSVNLTSTEICCANGIKTTAPTVSKINPTPEGSLTTSMEGNESSANLNANKLFFESIVDDLSSLCVKDQYDFKVEVLVLLKGFLLKRKC